MRVEETNKTGARKNERNMVRDRHELWLGQGIKMACPMALSNLRRSKNVMWLSISGETCG